MEMMSCCGCRRGVGWGIGRLKEGGSYREAAARKRPLVARRCADGGLSVGEVYLLQNKNRETIKTEK
jgi:hypothetical protein